MPLCPVRNSELCIVSRRLPVLTEAVHLLSDPRLGKGDTELVQKAGWRLLPFLVITSSDELSLVSCVARSAVVCRHPLTRNWAPGTRPTEGSRRTYVGHIKYKQLYRIKVED